MNTRIFNFLSKNKIVFQHQYGFRESKSTSLAILDLQSQLITNIEKKLFSCSICLDFSKAFDKVNHEILLYTLEHYGFTGIAYSWFKSHLHKRTETVSINGSNANELIINCGVPQGSVLGPLLFLIYINDIYQSSEILQFLLFADYTSILYASKSIDVLEQTINSELIIVSAWLLANKLSLNVSKSNFLLISFRKPYRSVKLEINHTNLKQENYTKYLGVIIDDKLNWKLHIKQIKIKVSKGIGILYKLRHLVPKQMLKTLYSSFIPSPIRCGILNWGCANKSTLEPLKGDLRKARRVTDFAHYTAHSEPIFSRLQIFNFDKLYMLETAKAMFEVNQNLDKFPIEHEFVKQTTYTSILKDTFHRKVFLFPQFPQI